MDAGIVSLKANDAWLSHARRTALRASSTRKQLWSQKVTFRYNNNTLRCKIAGFESPVTSSPPAEIDHQTQRIHEVLLSPNVPDPKNVAAFILGGGTGAHLFPLTKTRAVPAVPIAGGYKIVDVPMSNCINSGINKIYILTQFNSTSLNRHISRTFGDVANFGGGFAEVLAATQSPGETGMNWFQGTADAIRQFAWVFDDRRNQHIEHVLILSGDQLYRMNYMELIEKHVETGADITISCIPVDASRASDFGLVRVDKNGRITEFQEKPRGGDLEAMKDDGSFQRLSHQDTKKYPYIASMGIYVFNRKALQRQFMIRDGRANDFGQHILPFAVNYFNVQAYMFQDYWEDIGTIKAFFDANLALTEQPSKFQFYDQRTPMYTSPRYLPPTKIDKSKIRSSIISHGCFLFKCAIERSIIGVRSRVSAGAEVKNTLMFGANTYETEEQIASLLEKGMVPIGVGQNTKIRNCIIDTNARIGQNVVIANKDGVEEADRSSEGFYIRSGITIVLRNATIKDGTVI